MWKWTWSHVLTDVLMWDHAAKVKVVYRLWWCRLPVDDTVSFGSWAGRLCFLCVLCCRCPVGCGWVMMDWEHLGPVFPCINACSTCYLRGKNNFAPKLLLLQTFVLFFSQTMFHLLH